MNWTSIWEAFKSWASKAWNWLKRFFSVVWKKIKSWFGALRGRIADILKEAKEAVILDTETEVGNKIFEQIVENCPQMTSINKYDSNGKMTLGFDENHRITKVENYQSEVVENTNTDFDRDLATVGIIRMTN